MKSKGEGCLSLKRVAQRDQCVSWRCNAQYTLHRYIPSTSCTVVFFLSNSVLLSRATFPAIALVWPWAVFCVGALLKTLNVFPTSSVEHKRCATLSGGAKREWWWRWRFQTVKCPMHSLLPPHTLTHTHTRRDCQKSTL